MYVLTVTSLKHVCNVSRKFMYCHVINRWTRGYINAFDLLPLDVRGRNVEVVWAYAKGKPCNVRHVPDEVKILNAACTCTYRRP